MCMVFRALVVETVLSGLVPFVHAKPDIRAVDSFIAGKERRLMRGGACHKTTHPDGSVKRIGGTSGWLAALRSCASAGFSVATSGPTPTPPLKLLGCHVWEMQLKAGVACRVRDPCQRLLTHGFCNWWKMWEFCERFQTQRMCQKQWMASPCDFSLAKQGRFFCESTSPFSGRSAQGRT